MILLGLCLLGSGQTLAQETYQGEITAEDIGKWMAEDEAKRGYTSLELTEMIVTVSAEQAADLFDDALVEQLNVAHGKAIEAGVISESIQDRDAFLGSFVNTAGKCTMFHAAQRDSLVARGADGSLYETRRAKMATSFLNLLEAVERITEYPNLENDQVKNFNDSYEENIQVWWELMSEAGVEGSDELRTYNQWENKCGRSAHEFDQVWQEAKAMLDHDAIQAEAIKRLKAE